MTTQAKDNFENGIFWELYKDLERQFQNFLDYVPYLPRNEKIYSFKLLNLILSIGGHIDSAFKEMARYAEFSEKEACKQILKRASERKGIISTGVNAFDAEYGIATKKVKFKRLVKREDVIPFSRDEGENYVPEWWKFYNDLKHDVGFNIKEANLKNARDAVAGAFLLNVIHVPAALRLFKYGILKVGAHYEFQRIYIPPTPQMVENWIESKRKFEGSVSTPIFIYDYNQ